MSNFVSKDGVWYPKKERVSLKNLSGAVIKNPSSSDSKFYNEEVQPGDDFIYEGPDRAAMFVLWKDKVETLGQDFRLNMELIQLARSLGYKSVDAYAKAIGYDKDTVEEDFKKKLGMVEKYEPPKGKEEVFVMGGGQDTAGGGADIIGGFGEQRMRPASELEK